jgi:hypothetical protein
MSAENFLFEEGRGYVQGTKTIDTTYTVRVGTSANSFHIDRVVIVDDPAADFTITVPSGSYVGQQLLIVLESNTNSKTVTIDGNAAQDSTLTTAGQYQISEYTGATTSWVVLKESVAS